MIFLIHNACIYDAAYKITPNFLMKLHQKGSQAFAFTYDGSQHVIFLESDLKSHNHYPLLIVLH